MYIFNQTQDFPYLNKIIGFCVGVIFCIILSTLIPDKTQIITKYVSTPTPAPTQVVKVPVKLTTHDTRQINCMAENTYFEAGNQSRLGKIAVNNVVMNRTKDSRFPQTPCGVISQRSRRVCQFSWKCEGRKHVYDFALYNESKRIAQEVYLGNISDITKGAKFYHAYYVHPGWNLTRVAVIGAHIFYRG